MGLGQKWRFASEPEPSELAVDLCVCNVDRFWHCFNSLFMSSICSRAETAVTGVERLPRALMTPEECYLETSEIEKGSELSFKEMPLDTSCCSRGGPLNFNISFIHS